MVDKRRKTVVIKNRSTEHPTCPVKSDKHRVRDYWSYMVIKPYTEMDKPGIEFALAYYDNPGISIPTAVTTWVAIRAMPEFLARLRQATKNYKEFCKTHPCKPLASENDKIRENFSDDLFMDNILKSESNNKQHTSYPPKEAPDNNYSTTTDIAVNSPSTELPVTLPPSVQTEKDCSYWKYLHPTYYLS